jgi:hypothetical protein
MVALNQEARESLEYWLDEVSNWTCTCGAGAMVLCHRCFVATSLEAALDHVKRGAWAPAHRAASRAAGIEGLVVPLRDALTVRVAASRAVVAEISGPVADYYDELLIVPPVIGGPVLRLPLRVPSPPPACTAEEHEEIVCDAVRREAELDKIGQHHDRRGHHLQLANHPVCGSTLAWPLAGHRVAA